MKITGKMIGEELKSLRSKKGLSSNEVAKIIKIHPNSVFKYEKDASNCKINTFLDMLDLYDTDEIIFFKVISDYNHILVSNNNDVQNE